MASITEILKEIGSVPGPLDVIRRKYIKELSDPYKWWNFLAEIKKNI